MADNYIGINGIVTQDLNEIIADLTTKFKNIYGTDINIEQNSPDGQFINLVAQEKKDILDLCVQFYNNLDVDRVIGIPQQILYKLNGLIIKAYTYSYVYVNVTCTKPVNLKGLDDDINNADGTGYTVTDTNGNRWILAESQSLAAGTHLLNFRAADLGAVTALTNTITVMETIIAGVSGVNNPANNYITGAEGESDSQFRLRRNRALTAPAQGFTDALQGQLLNLDNVTQAKAYQNRTNTETQGIPAHTVWVIVEGGNSTDIGNTIYYNVPPGIAMKGDEEVTINLPAGGTDVVKYDLPTATDLYIMLDIKLLSGAIDQDYVKSELAKMTFEIGQTAEAVDIATQVKDIIGDVGSPYAVEISSDGINYGATVTPTNLDEYFSIDTDNIDITVV